MILFTLCFNLSLMINVRNNYGLKTMVSFYYTFTLLFIVTDIITYCNKICFKNINLILNNGFMCLNFSFIANDVPETIDKLKRMFCFNYGRILFIYR